MTLDQAREEYQHALRSTYVDRGEPDVGRTYYLVDEDKADALIAALTADNDALAGELGRKNDRNRQLTASVEKLERERDAYANAASDCHMWQLRAEQAERERAAARVNLDLAKRDMREGADAFYAQERKLEQAEAEAEKARLCPNCGARIEQCPICGGTIPRYPA